MFLKICSNLQKENLKEYFVLFSNKNIQSSIKLDPFTREAKLCWIKMYKYTNVHCLFMLVHNTFININLHNLKC